MNIPPFLLKILLKFSMFFLILHIVYFSLFTIFYSGYFLVTNSEFTKIGALFSLSIILRFLFIPLTYVYLKKVSEKSILISIIITSLIDFIVIILCFFSVFNFESSKYIELLYKSKKLKEVNDLKEFLLIAPEFQNTFLMFLLFFLFVISILILLLKRQINNNKQY